MYFSSVFSLAIVAQLSLASADAQITAAAVLSPRQNNDPSLVGWVSTSGASTFSVDRSCDFPATLSMSGSYAQCCAPTGSCPFYTSCSDGNLLAAKTSVFCDEGLCNTGVIIASIGASNGQSFLGCWPTDYGSAAFSLVQNIGTAPVATPTDTGTSSSGSGVSSSASTASGSTSSGSSSTGSAAAATTSATTGSSQTSTATTSASSSTGSKNAAASSDAPMSGLFGFVVAAVFGFL